MKKKNFDLINQWKCFSKEGGGGRGVGGNRIRFFFMQNLLRLNRSNIPLAWPLKNMDLCKEHKD